MTTAIVFGGQLRGFKYSAKTIQDNIVSAFPNSHIFYFGPPDPNGLDFRDYFPAATVVIEEDDLSCADGINPSGVGGGSNINAQNNGHKSKEMVQHFALQYYGIRRAFQLAEDHELDFDFAVRIRPCNYTTKKINFVVPKPDSIYIPNFDLHGGINDRFAYGDFDSMRKYCYFFDDVDHMKNGVGGAEVRIRRYLVDNGLTLREIPGFTFAAANLDGALTGIPLREHTPEHIDLSGWKRIKVEGYHGKGHGHYHPSITPEKFIVDGKLLTASEAKARFGDDHEPGVGGIEGCFE